MREYDLMRRWDEEEEMLEMKLTGHNNSDDPHDYNPRALADKQYKKQHLNAHNAAVLGRKRQIKASKVINPMQTDKK